MPLKSLGAPTSDFDNLFGRTGTDAAGAQPVTYATGGNATYTYSGKKIHVFTAPGTFDVLSAVDCTYVVIGGGGGGGGDFGAGGGAGDFKTAPQS